MLAYLQGLSLGLAYVAPIGVQNLFVINAGLSQPRAAAYRTALIVIFFDVTLALAGFFGIGALIEHSELIRKGVLLAGSLVVMYMGLRLMLSREVAGPSINVNIPLMKTIGMACVVTWFNPQAIIDGTMMLGAFRASLPTGGDLPFICGFGSASVIWFLTLSTIVPLVPVPDHHFLTLQEPVHAAPVAHHQPCLRPGHLFLWREARLVVRGVMAECILSVLGKGEPRYCLQPQRPCENTLSCDGGRILE